MIYVDSSVLLATLLAEDRVPADEFWTADLISSRLAKYEVMVRLQARHASAGVMSDAQELLRGLDWLELAPNILERALDPFPAGVVLRTLDALHVASADHLRRVGFPVKLATYDTRLAAAAKAIGLELAPL